MHRRIPKITLILLLSLTLFVLDLQGEVLDTLSVFPMLDSVLVIGNRIMVTPVSMPSRFTALSDYQIKEIQVFSPLEVVDALSPATFVMEKQVVGYGVGAEGGGFISMSGLGGAPTTGILVMINGHPDFMGIFGHPIPDVYGVGSSQRIDIIESPASTVFGGNAMGGVINIIQRPDVSKSLRFKSEIGSYETGLFSLALSQKFSRQAIQIDFKKELTGGHIPNSDYNSYGIGISHQINFNQDWNLLWSYRNLEMVYDDPVRLSASQSFLDSYAEISRHSAELSLEKSNITRKVNIQIYSSWGRHKFYDGFKSRDLNVGFSFYGNQQVNPQLVFMEGLDVAYYSGIAENPHALLPDGSPVVNPEKHLLKTAGSYLLLSFTPANKFNLKGGLRYQYADFSLSRISPQVNFSYLPFSFLKVELNYQTGFRYPTISELYLFPSSNEDLNPAFISALGANLLYSPLPDLQLMVGFSKSHLEDYIRYVPSTTPPPPGRFENVRSFSIENSYLTIHWRPLPGTMIWFSYNRNNRDQITAYNPDRLIKYGLTFRTGPLSVTLYGKYVEGLYGADNYQEALPDYNLTSLKINFYFSNFEFYTRIINLFDRTYYIRTDYRAPGRQIRLGFNFSF